MDTAWLLAAVFFVVLFVLFGLLKFILPTRKKIDLNGKHAFITGGSKGIGKAIALELVRRGASVTIVARDNAVLEDTWRQLKTVCELSDVDQNAQWFSLDLTKSPADTMDLVRRAEKELGAVDLLINNAGHSVQDLFENLPDDAFEKQMRINYLSAVYAARAVVPGMKERGAGRIVFVSSAAGQLGLFGYTAYAPTKFALRGLAESLQMELEPFGVAVTIVYPPNTNTEGFQEELRTMPEELREISEAGGLFEPKQVAQLLVDDMVEGRYSTAIGTDGWMLGVLTAGAAPETHVFAAAAQIVFGGAFRAILLGYHRYFRRIVDTGAKKRMQEKFKK